MGVKTFLGGVHPAGNKELSQEKPLVPFEPQGDMVFLTNQHIGKPAKPVVAKGDHVDVGQVLAEADGFISARIISSVSGTVKAIESRRNASGVKATAIVVTNDHLYTKVEGMGTVVDYNTLSNQEIISKVRDAGIVGMGGAGFPTHAKLTVKAPENIHFVIANGAECEPFITCDDQLMQTKAAEIVGGMEIMLRLYPHAVGVIVIEDNKPKAIAAMEAACSGSARVKVMPAKTKYPQGGERSLIALVAEKHLKMGMLPADVGCIVDNVGTIYAIYQAVHNSEPLTERGVTISGDGVENPGNFWVRIGTNYAELAAACGLKDETVKLLSGGPMMGIAMSTLETPICKNNNALTALTYDDVEVANRQMTPCLRCGRCNRVCPLGLSPQLMQVAATIKDYDRYEKRLYGLECIGCGCCTYNCPAKRPLMQLFKQTKAEILAAKKR